MEKHQTKVNGITTNNLRTVIEYNGNRKSRKAMQYSEIHIHCEKRDTKGDKITGGLLKVFVEQN